MVRRRCGGPVTLLGTWDASAPGRSAGGVCAGTDAALAAAGAWMRAHGGDCGLVEEVRLAMGTASLQTRHERTGRAWRAKRRRDGRIVFSGIPRPATAP